MTKLVANTRNNTTVCKYLLNPLCSVHISVNVYIFNYINSFIPTLFKLHGLLSLYTLSYDNDFKKAFQTY